MCVWNLKMEEKKRWATRTKAKMNTPDLPQEMIPPRPQSKKYFVEPNSHESPAAAEAAAILRPDTSWLLVDDDSHSARENGPLKGDWRAVSISDENMFAILLFDTVAHEDDIEIWNENECKKLYKIIRKKVIS